mmetsp:Transcript_24524/g.51341  ORF Transcript_24524/g.51341 Transcript_24524/m.51341 type:complete len:87 (-) Transcript_24524:311-571(-)
MQSTCAISLFELACYFEKVKKTASEQAAMSKAVLGAEKEKAVLAARAAARILAGKVRTGRVEEACEQGSREQGIFSSGSRHKAHSR